jgi:hypothetical protein
MTKVNLYAPFAGVKDGLTLCTLLRDAKKLEEVMGVIEILDGRIREINEAIEILGKASKMDALLREAKQKDQDALFVLNEANENAGQIQKDVKSWADDLREKIVEREDAVAAGEKALAEDKSRFNADAAAWQIAKAKCEAELADQTQLAARKLDEAVGLKKRYETALAVTKAGVAAA